ncbi:hypothetical protein [Xanthomonas sp. LMG 12460]|uniref:hypothetical protein n=1 Tax=Xanthomonas sp. LMG 12460 TaxID=1591132 RepID=UPI00186B09F0|nr:hypothetical protein [Xanthomonas sp. LMG 12460]
MFLAEDHWSSLSFLLADQDSAARRCGAETVRAAFLRLASTMQKVSRSKQSNQSDHGTKPAILAPGLERLLRRDDDVIAQAQSPDGSLAVRIVEGDVNRRSHLETPLQRIDARQHTRVLECIAGGREGEVHALKPSLSLRCVDLFNRPIGFSQMCRHCRRSAEKRDSAGDRDAKAKQRDDDEADLV